MIRISLPRFGLQVMIALLLGAAMLLCLPARAQSAEPAYTPVRITQAIDENSLVTLNNNTHPLAQARYDRGPAPLSMPASRLLLVLRRSAAQEAALSTYLQSLHDPASPNYRKWLTPEQFGQLYGVSDTDLATIEDWLQGHGFAVGKVAKSRVAIEFSGTVAQVQTAFHTSLHSYVVNGEQHWANASNPQIPAALEPLIAGLAELNNFVPKAQFIRAPGAKYNPANRRVEPTYTVGNASEGYSIYLGPADAATIYDTPTTYNANHSGTTYDGTGIRIGIAGDSNIDITQNANYRATFGLPANATQVVVDGTDPGENGDAIEAYLDTQVAGGIAPGASVTLYTAADTYFDAGLFLAIGRAIDDNNVDILNVSFGGCESAQGAAGNQYIYALWEQAAAQGISVTVSTGDSGSAGCDNPNTETIAQYGLAVNGLASTPYNIAVGGTDFDTLYSNFPSSFTTYVNISNSLADHRSALGYIPEEPWSDATFQGDNTTISQNVPWTATQYSSNANIVAGAGGVSSCAQMSSGGCVSGYPVPSWQSSFAADKSGRNLPDVSLLAGNGLYGATWGLCTDQDSDSSGNAVADCAGTPTTGNSFYLTGVGGTSAAAPAFAGILALVAQKAGGRLGQADYELYKLASSRYSTVFHDIATGNNSVPCTAGTPNCALTSSGYYFLSGYNTKSGYDEATGLGSVDATQLLNNWSNVGATATTASLTLNGGTSALTLTHGASVTVNADVTGSGGTPSGQVALVDNIDPATLPNNDSIGLFTLSGGSASGKTDYLPGGSYKVSAHYGGNNTFAQSDSNAIPVTVSAESSNTDLKVAAYYDPQTGNAATTPYYGYIYLVDAQPYGQSASAANPNGAATGTITFKSGSTTLGTAAIASDGIAELQTATLPGGANNLTAVFPGDASFLASTSSTLNFTVTPAVTALTTPTVVPFGNSVAGNSLTFALKLSADSAGAAPAGTVTFQNGSTTIGTAPMVGTAGTSTALASGQASFTTATLLPGNDSITAVYSGDGNYAGSTSSPVSVTVTKVGTFLAMTPNSTTILANQPLQVIVTPTPVSTLPLPTGTATLTYNGFPGVTTPAVNLINGSATIILPANSLSPGYQGLQANYSGDVYYAASTADTDITVNSSGTLKPTVTVTAPTGTVNYPIAVKVVLSGPSGDPTPTGSVQLASGNFVWSQSVSNGVTTFTLQNGLSGGSNTLTATYLGDSNYLAGNGTAVVTLFASPAIVFNPGAPAIFVNQPLSMTVTVGSLTTGLPTPTGTVTLSSGTYTSSPAQLNSGSASFTIPASTLPVGTDTLTASYSGDSVFNPGSSTNLVTVTAVPTPGLTLTGTPVTVVAGATAGNSSAITVTPSGGFTGSVALTAAITSSPAGAVNAPTLSFGTTTPVSITGTAAGTATLTVTTTAATTTASTKPARSGSRWLPAGGVVLATLLLLVSPSQRRRWRTMLGVVAFLAALTSGLLACGGGGSSSSSGGSGGGTTVPGTTPGVYTITVTGASGTLTPTATVSLTVE